MFSILQPQETGYQANQLRNVEVARQEYRLEGIGLYGQMIEAFSRCIIEDTEPAIGVEDGRHSVAVTLAPDMTPPLVSVTVPSSVARSV
jgi:hypothetical protein